MIADSFGNSGALIGDLTLDTMGFDSSSDIFITGGIGGGGGGAPGVVVDEPGNALLFVIGVGLIVSFRIRGYGNIQPTQKYRQL